MDSIHQARLAQSVEHQTLNRRVVGSSPTVDKEFFILYFVASDAILAGRLAPCKWNQAWRPSELYRCIEREKVSFKSREVNCLKECALALSQRIMNSTKEVLTRFSMVVHLCHFVFPLCHLAINSRSFFHKASIFLLYSTEISDCYSPFYGLVQIFPKSLYSV